MSNGWEGRFTSLPFQSSLSGTGFFLPKNIDRLLSDTFNVNQDRSIALLSLCSKKKTKTKKDGINNHNNKNNSSAFSPGFLNSSVWERQEDNPSLIHPE